MVPLLASKLYHYSGAALTTMGTGEWDYSKFIWCRDIGRVGMDKECGSSKIKVIVSIR